MTSRNFKNFEDMEAEYLRAHPEDIDLYMSEIFEEFSCSGDAAPLLASLRNIVQVKGISEVARTIGLSRQGLQKALSAKGNPRFENINSIINAVGYRLVPEKIDGHV